jgi:hypothetical protein
MQTTGPELGRQPIQSGSALEKNLRTLSDLAQGRKFQIWRYYIDHCTLLIRSPCVETTRENIDIVIPGVIYISARTSYESFSFELGTKDDCDVIEGRLARPLTRKEQVFCLIGSNWRDYVVALSAYPSVNSDSFHKTPDLAAFDPYTG